jgi:integrase
VKLWRSWGAANRLTRGNEQPETFAAKRWVPWLCAYTGARVGELAQLRKEDVQREGKHWMIVITPDAGTVKTNEARTVVLHPHLIELGFIKFVQAATPGHLFIRPSSQGGVLGPLQGLKNRLAEFVRTIVNDKNVAPNHAWRHRFKSIGLDVGIEHRILDAIQGQRPRNVAETYGEVSIKAQAAAIIKLPRYRVGK